LSLDARTTPEGSKKIQDPASKRADMDTYSNSLGFKGEAEARAN
jgi:BRCT domain type II-containing protein